MPSPARHGRAKMPPTRSRHPLAARLRRPARGDRSSPSRDLDQHDAPARASTGTRSSSARRRAPRCGPRPVSGGSCRRAPRPSSAPDGSTSSTIRPAEGRARACRAPPATRRPRRGGRPPTRQPELTFDQFVHRRRQPLRPCRRPGRRRAARQAYNPLFLYGPPGVGKTHLLHSIANYVQRYGDGAARPLHDDRGVHQRVRRRAARRRRSSVQAPLPRHRRPAHRRRPVPRGQDADRGGVLPHLQRALRGRRQLVADLRPPAARPRRASTDRLRERFESGLVADIAPARLATAPGRAAQARRARRHRRSTEEAIDADRRACHRPTCAPSRAR